MREVTDPSILDKLNGVVASNTGLKEVTDPDVLSKLNSMGSAPQANVWLSQDNSTPPAAQVTPQSQKGFEAITEPISNLISGEYQRGVDLADAVNRQNQGQQSPASTALQFGLENLAGGLSAPIGTAAEIAAKTAYQAAPAPVQQALNQAGTSIAQSPVGQAIGQTASNLANQYNQNNAAYAKDHPEAAANFKAMREGLPALLPFAAPEVRAVTEAAGEAGASALKNVTKDTIAKTAEAIKPETMLTSDVVKQMASTAYKTADEMGGTLSPQFANKLYDAVDAMNRGLENFA